MKWLVSGGAGFIGANAVRQLRRAGHDVVVFDNLSRRGAQENLEWLRKHEDLDFVQGDVRRSEELEAVFRLHPDLDVVLHLAGQVAVTLSVADPREDFEVNALGTFNVCEAVRRHAPSAILLNASTNKVYGEMRDVAVVERAGRYAYRDLPAGVPESRPLDFHSPYGCSKGAADQYVRDYARIYGLRTVNFRQSCIYGPRQFGVGDQGWVAWFIIVALMGRSLTIYGDGKQVRDVLYIDDLIRCYLAAVERIDEASGQTYNVGGGPANIMSLLELVAEIEALIGRKTPASFADWRPGDQRVFVCDVRKAERELGWTPKIGRAEGVRRLVEWVRESRAELERAGV